MILQRTCSCGLSYVPQNISEGACPRCRKLRKLRDKPLPIGRLVATPGALNYLCAEGLDPMSFVRRHQQHDWGDLCEEDTRANEEALLNSARIMSVYKITETEKVWIITEWDRSATTLLLPSEY